MSLKSILFSLSILQVLFLISYGQVFAQGEPPWRRPLRICYSADGISFSTPQIFQDSSGVPCVIKLPNGNLLSAFQWFRQPVGSVTWDRVAVKFSTDNGTSWSEPQPVTVNGLPTNFQRPFDPALAVTDDGRIRMYFSSGLSLSLDTSVNTYSAVSDDGINYVFDQGVRFSLPDKPVIDPAVIKFRNLWHLVNPVTMGTGAYHNISGNGIDFNRVQDIVSDMSHSWIGNFTIVDTNELRFYGSGGIVWYSSSPNGGQWSSFINTNIQGGDPSVLRLDNSNYLMIFTGPPYPSSVELNQENVDQYYLLSNYPNPFNPSTQIRFEIPSSGFAELVLFDASGKVVRTIFSDNLNRGRYKIHFEANELPASAYYCALILDNKILSVRKMILLK